MPFAAAIVSLPPPTPKIQILSDPFSPKSNPTTGHLKSCKNLQEIKQIHAQYTKHGLVGDASLLTKLIAKYSEMGSSESLEFAEKAFKMFKSSRKDRTSNITYLYNSLVRGNSLAGSYHEAISMYVDMLIDDLEPDNYTFPFVLSACAKNSSLSEARQIHGCVVKRGYRDDVFVSNSLVYCYGECGEIDSARKVFDEMSERNVVSWTSLICGFARRDRHREAVSLFFAMVGEGIEPNEVAFVSVVSACAELGDLDLGERVLNHVEECWELEFNGVMVNAVVDMYIKCGCVEKARRLFDECVDKDLVLYNTLMSNYVRLGKAGDALDVFRGMLDLGEKPDRITVVSVIASAAELTELSLGKQCHAYVLRNALWSWDSVGNSLIDMYGKCGELGLARRVFDRMSGNTTVVSWNSLLEGFARNGDVDSAVGVFDEMPERDVVSWNTMIRALVDEGSFLDAIELFRSMQREGMASDEVTMVSVVSACGYLGALDSAKWAYSYIKRRGFRSNTRLCTALVDMFARCGDPRSAMEVFWSMKERDVSAWTAAIGAMAMEGNGERALELFHEMVRQGIAPDQVAFSGVLTACSHAGLVEEGMLVFNSMKEYGVVPHVVHYGCVVDLLGRAGLLDEALEFIDTMPLEANAAIWGAFLGACRKHGNEKMASRAAKMMSECSSGGDQTGIHVLLSNIYASAGLWSDVARVRTRMKERGMRKTPGSSAIEVGGVVREFTSGDESACTASMLEEIDSRLRDAGYAPDLTNVLLDVDEQEKEFLLGRHSEKLAVAHGLVSSARGTPVRVVKNLRMCSDCHSFAKMVSKVYDREIVVRDNKRFHFFQQGLCSCRDYW
ncbi:pentatricopeptide repeat-containing protein At3g22690 [Salvia miltiorrhiza]|uniref:pentatricopeptide repeat-containing protein At3g22690 n=1 Tax=Salvia miltiorrhiza TaxID=226208 RepID=UPI0025AC5721|nr:pentatricopeptide repeat-containing protein At3g22690 [Salvia miltiorrhiza]